MAKTTICGIRVLLIMTLVVINLVIYKVTPPLLLRFKRSSNLQASSCSCDCYLQDFLPSSGIGNNSVPEYDEEMGEEMAKDLKTLLGEEMSLIKEVSNETMENYSKKLVMEAKATSSIYKREVEKCNGGISVCENARERVEAQIVKELKLSKLWEKRARQLGWKY